MTEYKINPVKGIEKKIKRGGDVGIMERNNDCYGICGAFSNNSGNSYMIDKSCGDRCDSYIEEQRHKFYGTGSCGHQAPYRPVLWNEVPHYFPALLNKGLSLEEALTKCKYYCENNNECKEACQLHHDSVERFTMENPLLSGDKLPVESRVEKSLLPVIIIVISISVLIGMRFIK